MFEKLIQLKLMIHFKKSKVIFDTQIINLRNYKHGAQIFIKLPPKHSMH